MTVGILNLAIFICDADSLKAKRMVLHSLKARLKNNFNVSIAQVGDEDKWQKATLAVVGVDADRGNVNRTLSNVVNFLERCDNINLIDYTLELI